MLSNMKGANKNIDKVFRDGLGGYQQQPPEEIWGLVKKGIRINPRRKILVPIWQVAAGAALLIAAGSLFYMVNRPYGTTLSEQIFPVPQIINNPTTPIIPDSAKINNNASNPVNQAPDDQNYLVEQQIHTFDSHNKKNNDPDAKSRSIIAANYKPVEIMNSSIPEKEVSGVFSTLLMPDSYLSTAKPDLIPRNIQNNSAGWDMLQSNDDLLGEESGPVEHLLLTAQVSPTYSYRDIGTIGAGGSGSYNKYESGRISYSGGLQFGYKTSERLSIHAGLMYSQLGYNINEDNGFQSNAIGKSNDFLTVPDQIKVEKDIKNSIGTLDNNSNMRNVIITGSLENYALGSNEVVTNIVPSVLESGGKIEQHFQYLELPFLLRYKIIDRNLDVNFLGGVSTNILVGNHTSLIIDNESSEIGSSENIKNFNYMGNIGLGFEYTIKENLIFSVEPQFKYFLNSINQTSLVSRPYMLGMFTGVRFMW